MTRYYGPEDHKDPVKVAAFRERCEATERGKTPFGRDDGGLHNPHWPNYRGWPLILNHVWAAVIANDALPFKGWCPHDEQEYFTG